MCVNIAWVVGNHSGQVPEVPVTVVNMPEEQKHRPAEEAATVQQLLQWKWIVMGFHSVQGWVHITVFIPCGERRIVCLCAWLIGIPPSELISGNPRQCRWQTTHRIKVWSARRWEESERWKRGRGRTKEKKKQMWRDATWLLPQTTDHTRVWIHSHIRTHSLCLSCSWIWGKSPVSDPGSLAGARFKRKMKGCGCVPADPTCCIGPVDPLKLHSTWVLCNHSCHHGELSVYLSVSVS